MNNFGDVKNLGDSVFELRIHYSAGYRIYFTKYNEIIVLLLCGGNKSSQEKDIKKAKDMLK
jgi:putative addiction module killer protein